VPPSPSQGQGGDPTGVLSPEGSAGGSKQASPGVLTAAAAGALESVRRRGVACIPVGGVGAGLPVVHGGASEWGRGLAAWGQRGAENRQWSAARAVGLGGEGGALHPLCPIALRGACQCQSGRTRIGALLPAPSALVQPRALYSAYMS
jgi:hypothetical protein